MPWWIPTIAAIMHLLSLAWVFLVLKDARRFIDGQLWVVSDENLGAIETRRLKLIRGFYVFSMLMWVPVSFILLYL
jgi:hypothetical protein